MMGWGGTIWVISWITQEQIDVPCLVNVAASSLSSNQPGGVLILAGFHSLFFEGLILRGSLFHATPLCPSPPSSMHLLYCFLASLISPPASSASSHPNILMPCDLPLHPSPPHPPTSCWLIRLLLFLPTRFAMVLTLEVFPLHGNSLLTAATGLWNHLRVYVSSDPIPFVTHTRKDESVHK